MATIYHPDGSTEEVQPENGKTFELEQLSKIVGGYIEVVYIPGRLIVCNEEGKLNGLPYNANATAEFSRYLPGDFLVGNILVCKDTEME